VGESQLFSPDKKLSGERKNLRRITFYRTSAERGGRSYLMASADKKLSITFYRAHDKERPYHSTDPQCTPVFMYSDETGYTDTHEY
jgi:hypothetical protein